MDLSPLSSGGNIAGQLSSSTNYTIDGMTAKGTVASGTTSGAYTISMEAVREFEVVTNQYDVTNGRSGGGTVSAVTKSGTNTCLLYTSLLTIFLKLNLHTDVISLQNGTLTFAP